MSISFIQSMHPSIPLLSSLIFDQPLQGNRWIEIYVDWSPVTWLLRLWTHRGEFTSMDASQSCVDPKIHRFLMKLASSKGFLGRSSSCRDTLTMNFTSNFGGFPNCEKIDAFVNQWNWSAPEMGENPSNIAVACGMIYSMQLFHSALGHPTSPVTNMVMLRKM